MKNIVKSIAVLLLFVSTSATLFAQRQQGSKMEMVMSKLTEKLSLTPDQQSKVKAIFSTHFDQMKALKEQVKNASPEDKKTALRAQWKKTDDAMLAVLDTTQKTKYQEAKKEMRKNRKTRNAEGRHKGKEAQQDVQELLDDSAY
ncbi:MAG: hypothetical protein V4538_11275 [Bacteroidota bacterium]